MPYIYSPKQGGMGNSFTAVADDEYLLFVNPAGLGVEKKFLKTKFLKTKASSIVYTPLFSLSMINGFFAIFDVVNQEEKFEYLRKNPVSFRITAPFTFSYLTDFWGITFLPIMMDLRKIKSDAPISMGDDLKIKIYPISIDGLVISQLSLGFAPVSFSFSESEQNRFHFGFAFRPFYFIDGSFSFDPKGKEEPDINFNFNEGVGMSLDLGILFEFVFNKVHKINLGLSITEAPAFYYPIADMITDDIYEEKEKKGFSFFQPNPRVGIAYFMPNYLDSFFRDLVISFDFHKWIDQKQSWGSKLRAGASVSIFSTKNINVNWSVGFNGGYFTSSAVLYLFGLRTSYSFYQEELGKEFRSDPLSRHEFYISLYF